MAFRSVSPQKSDSKADFQIDCRIAAEIEFAQLARVWRYSILAADWPMREMAFRDMIAAPVFSIEALKQKVDAVRGECAEAMVIDRNMTAHQIIAQDAVRVAAGLQV